MAKVAVILYKHPGDSDWRFAKVCTPKCVEEHAGKLADWFQINGISAEVKISLETLYTSE